MSNRARQLDSELDKSGLLVLAVLDNEAGGQRILVGNAGSSHWKKFAARSRRAALKKNDNSRKITKTLKVNQS